MVNLPQRDSIGQITPMVTSQGGVSSSQGWVSSSQVGVSSSQVCLCVLPVPGRTRFPAGRRGRPGTAPGWCCPWGTPAAWRWPSQRTRAPAAACARGRPGGAGCAGGSRTGNLNAHGGHRTSGSPWELGLRGLRELWIYSVISQLIFFI